MAPRPAWPLSVVSPNPFPTSNWHLDYGPVCSCHRRQWVGGNLPIYTIREHTHSTDIYWVPSRCKLCSRYYGYIYAKSWFVLSWGRQTTNRYRAPLVVKREICRAGMRKKATQQTPTYTCDPHGPSGTGSTGDPTYGKGEFQDVHSQVTQTSAGFSYSLTPWQVPVERLVWTVRQKKSKFGSQA